MYYGLEAYEQLVKPPRAVVVSEWIHCCRYCCPVQLSVAQKPGVAPFHGMYNVQDFVGIADRAVARYI